MSLLQIYQDCDTCNKGSITEFLLCQLCPKLQIANCKLLIVSGHWGGKMSMSVPHINTGSRDHFIHPNCVTEIGCQLTRMPSRGVTVWPAVTVVDSSWTGQPSVPTIADLRTMISRPKVSTMTAHSLRVFFAAAATLRRVFW